MNRGVAVIAAGALGLTMATILLPVVVLGGTGVATDGYTQTGPTDQAVAEIPPALLGPYIASPACIGLPWQIVAAIGWVESAHVHRGHGLDPATGAVTPPLVGPALNGVTGPAVPVPDGASPWHDDPTWDHPVGPLGFTTAEWAHWGVDASGDGVATPHNAYDAISATGRLLCHGRPRLDGSVDDAVALHDPGPAYIDAVRATAYRYGMPDPADPNTPPDATDGVPYSPGEPTAPISVAGFTWTQHGHNPLSGEPVNEYGLTKATAQVQQAVRNAFPYWRDKQNYAVMRKVKTATGWGDRWSPHAYGAALDFVLPGHVPGPLGERLYRWIIDNAPRFPQITYVIYNYRIWHRGDTVDRPIKPGTLAHTDHVHVSTGHHG